MSFEEIEGSAQETESGASSEASPEPSEGEGSEAASGGKQTTDSDNVPFHEHPRFRELVEQKNQALAQQKALEDNYKRLEQQLQSISQAPKTPEQAQTDELIEQLKTIDPKFAARIEQLTKTLPQVESLQQKLQNYEQQQIRTQAVSEVNKLHEQNKTSPELKQFINNQLDFMAMQGQLKSLQDIPNAFNKIHGEYKKFIDGIERSTRESYVAAKKADAKTPTSQPKGAPVSHAPKTQTFSKDPEVARQQIVSRYLKQAKAAADI